MTYVSYLLITYYIRGISKKDIQVHALLALENFGVTHNELFKTLHEEIKYEKFFRQDCIMFTDFLILRYTHYT
jgi:hypothetical protein